ncbi:dipeptidase [Streptomyces scopuliridis]|uniref:Diguanylate cyclase n=1 Tax=Streptomyces scopuliridis RB72 TaxID=1440053 RepID=A0A2T7TBE3_9ACTN|nr:membrane dipeptidase [Streptomyces scopuliridis]PVE12396.1 diguanylate cyclase [Streptomyces scopuliridis RB72]
MNTDSSDLPDKTRRRLALWDEYRSYQYLRAGQDFEEFDFVPAVGRVPGGALRWSDAVEERARDFEAGHLVVSAHDHLSLRPADPELFPEYRRQGRESTPYEGIAHSGVDLFFDGGPAAVSMIRSHTPWDWDDAVSDLAMRQSDWAHQGLVAPVRSLEDARRAQEDGKVGVVLTLEAATPIGNDIDRLDLLYGLGVRLLGLVYSESNQLGSGLADTGDAGLTTLGRRALRRMNDLGIIVDVSHTGDATALDAARLSQAPVVITHAGSRALWPTARMKPDNVIKACADTGGFIGIEAAPHTTVTAKHPRHSLDSVMEHVERCVELVGIDHVAFGPDTNFGDHVAWHKVFAKLFGKDSDGPRNLPPHETVGYVHGCENPAESVRNMIRWLFEHGWSDEDVAKIAGGNVQRVATQVWTG